MHFGFIATILIASLSYKIHLFLQISFLSLQLLLLDPGKEILPVVTVPAITLLFRMNQIYRNVSDTRSTFLGTINVKQIGKGGKLSSLSR